MPAHSLGREDTEVSSVPGNRVRKKDFENQSMNYSFCLFLGCFRILFLMVLSRKSP